MIEGAIDRGNSQALRGRVAYLETVLAQTQATLAQVTAERDKLRRAYELLVEQVELLRRRIFMAKSERVDATQLELQLAETEKRLDALATQIIEQAALASPPSQPPASTPPESAPKPRPKPTGRRDLAAEDLPEERVEILDPVREGQVERIDFEESSRLAYRRGGMVRIVVARATYKSSPQPAAPTDASPVTAHAAVEPLAPPVTIDTAVEPLATPATTHAPHAALSVTPPLDATPPHAHKGPRVVTFVTAKKPKELVERGILAPTMIAHVLVSKYRWGLPFHRLARMFSSHGFSLDDGTMCRPSETKRGATCHTRSNVSWTTASVSTTAAK